MLLAGPAQANHCDIDVAEVESLLVAPLTDDANKLDAAEALLGHAISACAQEEQELAEAALDSPMLDPDYVTLGLSMLINAQQLVGGN